MASTQHLDYWDDELAELDAQATAILGKAAVLAAIARVPPLADEMTRANILVTGRR